MVFDWLLEGQNASRLAQGLWITAKISFISVAFSSVFGVLMGGLMCLPHRLIRFICQIYLEIMRIVPILVWLFVLYFGLATWGNIHISGEWVCIWVFTLWGTAEMGDLVRGALMSIGKEQVEAGLSTGLTRRQVFQYVQLPQSVRRVVPSTVNLFTRMIKTSSLASLIGVVEVIKVGQQIIENTLLTTPTASLWVYGLIFVLYFLICYPLSLWANHLEKNNSY